MRWIAGVAVAALGVMGIAAALSHDQRQYEQTKCEIDEQSDYALIWMKDASKVGKGAHLYSIQFEPSGLTVRFPPTYYAADWGDTEVVFEYPDNKAAWGVLKLRSKGTFGWNVETIGRVQRPCWTAMKKYIREHVESKGTVVHISETTAK
jgi:hypothetical protein